MLLSAVPKNWGNRRIKGRFRMPDLVAVSKPIRRIVVKVGTHVITNKDNRIVSKVLAKLVEQIAYLYEQGIVSVLVSSGSVSAGKEVMSRGLKSTDKIT